MVSRSKNDLLLCGAANLAWAHFGVPKGPEVPGCSWDKNGMGGPRNGNSPIVDGLFMFIPWKTKMDDLGVPRFYATPRS
jgi:hypothetical protein